MTKAKDPRGRKTVEDKKIQICIYIRQSHVDALGGSKMVKWIGVQHIENQARKKLLKKV